MPRFPRRPPLLFLLLPWLLSPAPLGAEWVPVPIAGPEVKPIQLQEWNLTELEGEAFPLGVETVTALLEAGGSRLALELADQALGRGVGYGRAAPWRGVKALALQRLGRSEEAGELLEALPREILEQSPELALSLAESRLAAGHCPRAREWFARVLQQRAGQPPGYRAQLGIIRCAVRQGAMTEAEMQLQLYLLDPLHPSTDPDLARLQAELAHLRGARREAEEWLAKAAAWDLEQPEARARERQRLADLTLPEALPGAVAGWERLVAVAGLPDPERLEARLTLARLYAQQGRPGHALYQLEEGLREGAPVAWVREAARLYREWWRQPPTEEPPPHPAARVTWQRREWIARLMTTRDGDERLRMLANLLNQEVVEGLGYLTPEGPLTPTALGWTRLGTPHQLLYADAYRRTGSGGQAAALLERLAGAEVEALRLVEMAGRSPMPDELPEQIRYFEELPREEWTMRLEGWVAEAWLLLAEAGRSGAAGALEKLLAPRQDQPLVQRAIRYRTLLTRAKEGREKEALLELLVLAATPAGRDQWGNPLPEPLPTPPARLAAQWLERQGDRAGARAVTRLWGGGSGSTTP